MGLRSIIFAVNKMDEIGFDKDLFHFKQSELTKIATKVGFRPESLEFVPIMAIPKKVGALQHNFDSQNIVQESTDFPVQWYKGPCVFTLL